MTSSKDKPKGGSAETKKPGDGNNMDNAGNSRDANKPDNKTARKNEQAGR